MTGRMQLQALFTYYNFVRVHSAIKMTPAEKAGVIEYWGKDTEKKKWLYLIEQTSEIPVFILMIGSIVFWYKAYKIQYEKF